MKYLTDLWHDLRSAARHFYYIRTQLRQGYNPDEVPF
jgi:hypothetical protein